LVANGQTISTAILGVNPADERTVSIVLDPMVDGDFDRLNQADFQIVLGSGLAANLGVIPGDLVTLLIPEATLSLAGVTPRLKRLEVAGVFEVGAQLDNQLAFVGLEDGARLFKIGDGAAAVRFEFDNLFDAPEAIRPIAQAVSTELQIPI
jgi:ABC-type transport system, involved in lipoprotein release, permease component